MSDDTTGASASTPIAAFFAAVAIEAPGFSYRPSTSAHKNFARLCRVSGWEGNSPARAKAREGFKAALVQQFNFIYGIDGKDLAAWQNLCRVIGIAPVPDTLEECRKVVWDAHVNIIDLIETARTGRPVRRFNTLGELIAYTKRTDKFFPKQEAYEGGLLKELLREIVNPYYGKRCNGSQKRKARKARKRAAAAAL